jgi:hypothetical protein
MATPLTRLPVLLDIVAFTRSLEGAFVAELTQEERRASGAPDDWAAKDLVAHVTTWRERGLRDLEAARLGRLDPEPQEFDEVNRAIFEENSGLTWEAVLRRVDASWEGYSGELGKLPEEALNLSAEGQPSRPLWRRITVDAGNHPCLHYAEFARRHGRSDSAERWMEGMAPLLARVDPAPEWQAVIQYNLACHYALSAHPQEALAALRASLEHNPGLRDWARQDPDLAALHTEPSFGTAVGPAA